MTIQHPGRIRATIESLVEGTLPAIQRKYKDIYVYSHSKPWRPPSGRASSDVSDPTGSTVAEGEKARAVLAVAADDLAELVTKAKDLDEKLFALVKSPGARSEGNKLVHDDEVDEAGLRSEIRELEQHRANLKAAVAVKVRAIDEEIASKRATALKLVKLGEQRQREEAARKRAEASRIRRREQRVGGGR